jgi:hypothetical protein
MARFAGVVSARSSASNRNSQTRELKGSRVFVCVRINPQGRVRLSATPSNFANLFGRSAVQAVLACHLHEASCPAQAAMHDKVALRAALTMKDNHK